MIADLNGATPRRRAVSSAGSCGARPDNSIARHLLSQIDTDPRALLGTQSYSYTLRQGETLSTVAGRTLGNPMLFYALARYNNIAVPSSVMPGQTIQVPGRRPAAAPAPAPARPETRPSARPPRATPPQTLAPAHDRAVARQSGPGGPAAARASPR